HPACGPHAAAAGRDHRRRRHRLGDRRHHPRRGLEPDGGLRPGHRHLEDRHPAAGRAVPQMAVTYRGEIIVLGGWEAQGGNLTAVSSKKVYAQRGGGWVELPPMLSSHVAGGAVVVGDQIIVSGGQADGKLNPTTEVFDGTAWKRVTDLPTPREHLGM